MSAPAVRDCDRTVPVLVVLQDRSLANTVAFTLQHGNYAPRIESTVSGARAAIAEWKPDLLLVEIDLEAGAGIQLIQQGRAGGPIGVIALTGRSDLPGKLDAFERGADDYIGVPFFPDDFVARSRAVMRRTHGSVGKFVPCLRVGDLEFDVLDRKVIAGDHEVHLSSLEQALLYLFAANAGIALTRKQILDALWGTDFVSKTKVVDWHVRGLRAKLEDHWPASRYIETVQEIGYRFVPTAAAERNGTSVTADAIDRAGD